MTHVPMPKGLPVVGNLLQFPRGRFMQHLMTVARRYDGIFRMDFGGRVGTFVYHPDLVAELSDQTRFRKTLGLALYKVRDFAGDGLFTAFNEEPNWGRAHRILMPAFGIKAMRGYYPVMLDVARQLVRKWRAAENRDVVVADDMTRLTLDTISLAGFGYRFNSFDQERLHPFLEAMSRGLGEAMAKLTRLPIVGKIPNKSREARYAADVAEMHRLVDTVIAERRAKPTDGTDLLNLMLSAVDPDSGERLDDTNIRYQVITFLIAGHETTSGLLTFATYLLMRHPGVLAQAYAEVDRVLGEREPEYADITKLTVIDRVLKETQRLFPTAPAINVAPIADTTIGDGIALAKDKPVVMLLAALHRHPAAWPDPDTFDIDRWLPEREATHHPHAYKPFGNGVRACIGRQFALTEARLALAMILQSFALSDPLDYKLSIKETLTLKPDDFRLRVRARRPHERMATQPLPAAAAEAETDADDAAAPLPAAGAASGELTVVYGSSLGTCREISEQIAERGTAAGYSVVHAPLDACADALPERGTLVVVTATYNGRAPDSATRIEAAIAAGRLATVKRPDLRVAVLGCGNTQWAATYQHFPKLIETTLAATGARAVVPRGEANAEGDFDGAVEAWLAGLWRAMGESAPAPAGPALSLTFVSAHETRARVLPLGALSLEVLENRELVREPAGLWDFAIEPPRGSTRQLALRLPEGADWKTGDHLAVYARNRPELVSAVAARLGLRTDEIVVLDGQGARVRHLPIGQPVTIGQLLRDFIELQDPATRADLATLRAHTRCPVTGSALEAFAGDSEEARARHQAEIADRRVTTLDLLTRFPAIELGLEGLLAICGAIRPRFYSISSSPLADPRVATLTVGAVQGPAWSGSGDYQGVASSYVRGLRPGDEVMGFPRRPNPPFAPPADARVPLVLIGAGTGIAPFRGFLQDRAARRGRGEAVGPARLYFGCRHPDHDYFYRDELEAWAADGLVSLRPAFSTTGAPHKYVQDAVLADGEAISGAYRAGGVFYVCGDGRYMAPAVRDALIRVAMLHANQTHAQASKWLEGQIESGRFHQDVFGG